MTTTKARKPYVRKKQARPRPSIIEAHPERARIEHDLMRGVPPRIVAQKYELSDASVYRHKNKLPPDACAKQFAEVLKPGSSADLDRMKIEASHGLLAKLETHAIKINMAIDVVLENGNLEMFNRMSGQFHRNWELQARYLGQLGEAPTTVINNNYVIMTYQIGVKELLLKQLERHPEDRDDIIAGLENLQRRHLLAPPKAEEANV